MGVGIGEIGVVVLATILLFPKMWIKRLKQCLELPNILRIFNKQ